MKETRIQTEMPSELLAYHTGERAKRNKLFDRSISIPVRFIVQTVSGDPGALFNLSCLCVEIILAELIVC